MHDSRFVENIPRHITPKSEFESFAEYTQCIQEGPFRLEATADIPAGEELYVRHAPGASGLAFTRTDARQVHFKPFMLSTTVLLQ